MKAIDPNEDIPSLIRQFLKKNKISEAKIAEKTANRIKQSSINDLKNGRVVGENAAISTLYWLSVGLETSPVEVFAIALNMRLESLGVQIEDDEIFQQFKFYFSQLSLNRKIDLLDMAKLYLEKESPAVVSANLPLPQENLTHEPKTKRPVKNKSMTVREAFEDNNRNENGE